MGKKKHNTLQHRFLIYTLAISLLLIVLTVGVTFVLSTQKTAETSERYLTTYIQYSDDMLSGRISNAMLLANTVATDKQIIQKTIQKLSPEASYDWFRDQMNIRSYLNGLIVDKGYITRIAIVLENRIIYSSGDTFYWHSIAPEWMQGDQTSLQIRYLTDQDLTLIRRPIRVSGEIQGNVLLFMNDELLCDGYAISPLADSMTYVLSPEGKILFVSGKGSEVLEEDRLNRITTGWFYHAGRMFYALRYENAVTGITSVSLIPYESFMKDLYDWGVRLLVLILLAVALAVLVSRLMGRMLFRNLNILMDCMRAVRHGDLTRRAIVSSKDEISEAADSFNRTMIHIEKLTQDIRVQEAQKRSAELQALEAQIRPHFVYNSISAMQYAAQLHGETEVENAAQALGTLMRSVLGNQDAFITLWEEKSYIDSYIVLQRFKFKNQFQLIWEVDEPLWTMTLPKLLLQPLVENALLHGIRFRDDGVINVSATAEGTDRILIRVTDNGVGMTDEQIDALTGAQRPEKPESFRSVGIQNVRSRIQLYYPEKGDFRIYSLPGQFTCAEIVLPREKEEAEP
ncbi:MAG: histidine kinase [Clostridia bacterium]|nr:histidine kinase [Clostridia bacterium]